MCVWVVVVVQVVSWALVKQNLKNILLFMYTYTLYIIYTIIGICMCMRYICTVSLVFVMGPISVEVILFSCSENVYTSFLIG